MKVYSSSPHDRNRQGILLLLLIVAVGMFFWYQRAPAGTAATTSNPVTATPATVALPLPEPVKLAALDVAAVGAEVGRSPFAYGTRPAPPPPPRPVALPPPMPIAPVVPSLPAGPPPIALKLAGITTASGSGRPMVTLKDPASTALYQAFEGDIVDGRYRIVKIGQQSVVVSYVDGSGSRTIPLGG
ncbi:MAG: hypothetical protein ABI051_07110 [Vicinamibacterales bacterium]